MKIVHISPSAPYNDYWGYQENLLPKYQRKLGHNVSLIITNKTHKDGKVQEIEPSEYILNDGVHVIRRKWEKILNKKISTFLNYMKVYDILNELNPDYIFFHGLNSCTILDVIRYKKKNPECVIVQDNHLDKNIGLTVKNLRDIIIRTWFRFLNRISIKYVDKVYGVTPWRQEYAEEYFGIPKNKTDILIMGADDECINLPEKKKIRDTIRKQYAIPDDKFVVISGGKIDSRKKIHILAEVCSQMPNIVLMLFGCIAEDIEVEMNNIIACSDNIIFLGWIQANKVYNYFLASDLAFFPGQHSVLWEQACACKIPCVFKKWDGMDHVNNGGNSLFQDDISYKSIQKTLSDLLNTKKYKDMKSIAESKQTDIYLYSEIAKESLRGIRH